MGDRPATSLSSNTGASAMEPGGQCSQTTTGSWILWVPSQLNSQGEGGVSPLAWRVQEQEEQCLTPWKGPSGAVLFLLSLLLILGFSLFSPVSHREGKFRFELSKLMIVAKTPRDEL